MSPGKRHHHLDALRAFAMLLGIVLHALLSFIGGHLKKEQANDAPQPATDLWSAARIGDTAAIESMLSGPIDINARDGAGLAPLSWAALLGETDAAALLLEHRAEVDIRDNNEATPLHAAAFLGRLEVAKLLVENGAELNARGGSGETPIDSASADWGIVEYITGILQIEIDEAVVRAGRSEVAAYLASQGAKHSADLAGGSPNFDKLVGLIEFLAIFPVFHHLWFLYDLLWLVAGFVLVVWIIRGRGWRLPAAWLMAQGPDSEIAVGPVRQELQKDGDTPPQTKSEGPT